MINDHLESVKRQEDLPEAFLEHQVIFLVMIQLQAQT